MLCPIDGSTLLLSERQGIEIDYCPQCRGVWLDRGELDKLIERGDNDDDDDRDRRRDSGRWEDDRPRDREYAPSERSRILSSSPRSSHTPRHWGQ